MTWWQAFFDEEYLAISEVVHPPAVSDAQVEGLWALLGLTEGARVLDAPCGYGRLSRRLADRGAAVVGVDQSQALLTHAENRRGGHSPQQLRYMCADLRKPLDGVRADVALNVFSSLGYSTELDDRAILSTLRDAVSPAGRVFVETIHRDVMAARLAQQRVPSSRGGDGMSVSEHSHFDPVTGRVETTWHWSGDGGSGSKTADVRVYSITELIALAAGAGLALVSAHAGCTPEGFEAKGPDMGGAVGLLFEVSQ